MVDDLYLDVLPKTQLKLFKSLSSLDWIGDFYLAGGTALALQIGHRRSVDFDFFTPQEFDALLIKKRLNDLGSFELFSESEGTINARLDKVQISFFTIPYPLIKKVKNVKEIRLASKEDIAAMKLSAISNRGSRKDFVDMYFLFKEYSLAEMIKFFEKKYGKNRENAYSALKGLVYFKDAEEQPMPKMLKSAAWKQIKAICETELKRYLKSLE
ncbi:MAG: nucleotidyl transferase AbiEii/AbiGii toxin family protein [Candidatus Margulisiibacteriota bacterium]|nr:nucleotidyl transferase AbiEii/AbiGii toxin family protein [Candidatus Margulisiibacteriota bacterium]